MMCARWVAAGLVDYKVCAVDEIVWLKFAEEGGES